MFSLKVLICVCVTLTVCYAGPKVHKLSNKRLGLDGGVDVGQGQFPFQASLQWCFLGICEHICGGVILNENWILTGAECLDEAKKVIVGAIHLHEDSDDKQTVDIEAKFAHPDFDATTVGPNDVGLIRLKTSLTYNTNVQPAKLPTQGQVINGTADVSGYGLSFLPNYNNLQAVFDVPIISFEDCNQAITSIITDEESPLDANSNLCTLSEASNNCDGDSGGPLSQNGVVVGTVTWFIDPCGTAGAPNVYTNIANFVDWIQKTIDDNQ